MLHKYKLGGEEIDSIELKALLITKGINVPSDDVYEHFAGTHRLSSFTDPMACNCLLLPDNTIVHIVNVGPQSPFSIGISQTDKAHLAYEGEFVTEVDFPPRTEFYEQNTSGGVPFNTIAVLQGLDVLSFPYLWPCEYARAGHPCHFCYQGAFTHYLAEQGAEDLPSPAPRDVAEVVNYAVNVEKVARYVQITGGSTMNPQAECHLVAEILEAIDDIAGLGDGSAEILVYTSPPSDPAVIDEVFAAGAHRVACDIEVWDEELAGSITPGKIQFAGRDRQLRTLLHIADKYGPNKACSAFVAGVEPVESFLSGAEYLASHGVVPIASIWLPHGRPVLGMSEAPDFDYYRQLRYGLAEIYLKYECEPPGAAGFNVCLCRDVWNHRTEVLDRDSCCSTDI
jgi:hypothetical protein